MQLSIIELGMKYFTPERKHPNDVGADVYYAGLPVVIEPGKHARLGLGFGLAIPVGYCGKVEQTSGMAKKGYVVMAPPIDPDYTGEIGVYIFNASDSPFEIVHGFKVGQLIISPVVHASFTVGIGDRRSDGREGSTGVTAKNLCKEGE